MNLKSRLCASLREFEGWASEAPSWTPLLAFILVFLAISAWLDHADLIGWGSMVGEFAIAAVIYYEVEEHRASSFLAELQGADFATKRAQLYNAYARLTEATPKERAEAFRKQIWSDPKLREACDTQWTYFCRLGHSHRRRAAKWFPQVVVSFWIMTARYNREHEERRGAPFDDYGTELVRLSVSEIYRHHKHPPEIYPSDGAPGYRIPTADFVKMLSDPYAPFV